MPNDNGLPHTSSHLYSRDYFLTACEGYEVFAHGDGNALSPRLAAVLEVTDLRPGERVLDVGCGRGEFVRYLALNEKVIAYGVDYSADAVAIAREHLTGVDGVLIAHSDARRLPFAAGTFDKLFMLDIVEHLYPWELAAALREAGRVLADNGQLVIHTAPNRWYYRFGYPVYRLFERLRGNELPANPRDRFPYHHLHVNEQDIVGLARSLRRAGFKARVRLRNIKPPSLAGESPVMKLATRLLETFPFKLVFCNDLIAVAQKESRREIYR